MYCISIAISLRFRVYSPFSVPHSCSSVSSYLYIIYVHLLAISATIFSTLHLKIVLQNRPTAGRVILSRSDRRFIESPNDRAVTMVRFRPAAAHEM
jgi:hypothetical protein